MNYIKKLYEFKREDRNLILSENISKNFTVAFEFEIETNDENLMMISTDEDALNWVKERLVESLTEAGIKHIHYQDFIEHLTNLIDFDDEESTFDFLQPIENVDDPVKNTIIEYLIPIVVDSFELEVQDDENIKGLEYAEKMVKKHLPAFHKKWNDHMNYEFDLSLNRGVELNNKTYVKGINTAIELIKDFFNDFEKQEYWFFTKKTSIHINIGLLKENVDWNLLKGLVFLKDWRKRQDEIPFAFYKIPERINNKFALSIIEIMKKKDLTERKFNLYDIKEVEEEFVDIFLDIISDFGDKTFGFNILQAIRKNYIEFRHIGGENLTFDIIQDKLLYFSYIVYLMTNPNFKRKEYLKKLYKLVKYLK